MRGWPRLPVTPEGAQAFFATVGVCVLTFVVFRGIGALIDRWNNRQPKKRLPR